MEKHKCIDVVVPTYHPDEKLEKLIKRLQKQTLEVRHIYVIDTRSEYFPASLEHMPGVVVKHISPTEFDHGATRDMGMHLSDAEVVVFMTQDAVPADDNLIKKLTEPLYQSKLIGAFYGRQLPTEDCDTIERYTRAFNYPPKSRIKSKEDIPELGIKTFFCSNVCAAYRRDIYEKMGGFCKKTIFNEDMILAGQMILAGYHVAYVAEARVIHSHNYSGRQQFHRNFDLAVSQADHPEVFANIRSESEGIRLVKQTAKYLMKIRKPQLLPALIYKSGCKYLGYKLGQNYRQLPMWLVKMCSMSTRYWEK